MPRDLFGQLDQRQTQTLPHTIQTAHPADPPEHLRGVQALAAVARHQSGGDQLLQHHVKTDRAQVMLQQALAEIDQRGGMEQLIAHLPVQGEIPTGMVAEQIHRLTVGRGLQILQQAYPQQEDRFNGQAAVVRAIASLQFGANPGQRRIDLLREKPVTVGVGKEAAGEPGGGKEFRLGGEGGQAHNLARDKANTIRLPYGVVTIICKLNLK